MRESTNHKTKILIIARLSSDSFLFFFSGAGSQSQEEPPSVPPRELWNQAHLTAGSCTGLVVEFQFPKDSHQLPEPAQEPGTPKPTESDPFGGGWQANRRPRKRTGPHRPRVALPVRRPSGPVPPRHDTGDGGAHHGRAR